MAAMSKRNYRLQSVMDACVREKQERARVVAQRRAGMVEAESELARRVQEVARCRERQAETQERMAEEARGGAGAARIVSYRTHLADLRQSEQELSEAVAQQRAVVARCEAELEKALEGLREASREFRIIEKHYDRWHEEQRRGETRREQKLNDEIASILIGRRSSE